MIDKEINKQSTIFNDEPQHCIAILEGCFREGGKESPEFQEYSRRSNANGEAHGGEILHKYIIAENLAQGNKPDFILIVRYPSHEIAHQTFTCDEYKSILPLRAIAFKEVKILLVKNDV